MSHYARLIKPLTAVTTATREAVELPIDTEVKRVNVTEGGYAFQALYYARGMFGGARGWLVLETDEDLPAFTDKGRAARAERRPRGRPPRGKASTASVQPVAVRLDEMQRAWVRARAESQHLTVSEYIRNLLTADGLPA